MVKKLIKNLFGVIFVFSVFGLVSVSAQAGSLEPGAPPNPTMKSLDQIPPTWDQVLPSAIRFQLVMGGAAVLDKETGLVWEQSPSAVPQTWFNAQRECGNKSLGGRKGWRTPTIPELASLIDPTVNRPALPGGHPFSNVQSQSADDHHPPATAYWSATTMFPVLYLPASAWAVDFTGGDVQGSWDQASSLYVWCVRGGSGVDVQ